MKIISRLKRWWYRFSDKQELAADPMYIPHNKSIYKGSEWYCHDCGSKDIDADCSCMGVHECNRCGSTSIGSRSFWEEPK